MFSKAHVGCCMERRQEEGVLEEWGSYLGISFSYFDERYCTDGSRYRKMDGFECKFWTQQVEGKGGIEDDFQDSIFIICVDGGINSSFGEDWGRSGFEEHIKTSFVHKFDTHRKYPNIHVSRQVGIGAQGTEKCESRNLAVMREI